MAVSEAYHNKQKPRSAKLWEKGALYITMNNELRSKIGKMLTNIEMVMVRSIEVQREKFLFEPDDKNLKLKKEQLLKLQKTIK